MSRLYRVAWRNLTTGFEGRGDLLTYDLAQSWVSYGNEMYGRNWRLRLERRMAIMRMEEDDGQVIDHWLESDAKTFENTEGDRKESTAP
jgi:hypothetical protein